MHTSFDAEKLELSTAGIGFHAFDKDGNITSIFFPDLNELRGLKMLEKMTNELQAMVLDKLIEEEEAKK